VKAGRGGLLALAPIVAALAASAPAAHAGSYDVLSCTIDGSYHPNNAWVATNNPAGDARYVSDASCSKSGDPLQVTLAGGNLHQLGRGWRTVKTTRTRKGGAYSTRYRFNSATGRFTFRMRLRPSDSYPYARGTSQPMRVRVG
jgi:hypothetical protein